MLKQIRSLFFFIFFHSIFINLFSIPKQFQEGFYILYGPNKYRELTHQQFSTTIPKDIDRIIKDNPYISGFLFMEYWSDFEKEEGKYDHSRINIVTNAVAKHNLNYKLVFMPGKTSPDWIYNKGIDVILSTEKNKNRKGYGEDIKVPLPWDKKYQEIFFKSAKAFFTRYKADPHFISATITIANQTSPEWHMPKGEEELKQYSEHGDYKSKIRDSWITAIDYFAELLPNKQLILSASSDPIHGMRKEANQVIEYGAKKYPKQFTLHMAQLNGKFDQINIPAYKRILDYKDIIKVGMQNVSFLGDGTDTRQGSFEMTAYNYVQSGANYLELWRSDASSKTICKKLYKLIEEAKQNLEAFKFKLKAEGKFKELSASRNRKDKFKLK